MFAGINVLLVIFVYFFIPETRNVMLEEMDAKFGGTNHVEKGGDIMGVEDAHHADAAHRVGSIDKQPETEHIQEVRH